MKDFVERLESDRLMTSQVAIDLEVQLEKGTGTRPVLWLLHRAKQRAASACADLARVSPLNTAAIITLQTQIQIYDELMGDCRDLLTRGHDADRRISDSDREEIVDALDPDEARDLGLQQTPEDV